MATPVLADAATLAVDATWVARVTAAVERQAITIGLAILQADSPSGQDRARWQLAQAALKAPSDYGARFAWALACYDLDSAATDTQILGRVQAAWNLIANVPV